MAAAKAHAKWDYETSMTILRDRKRLWLLALMLVPIVLGSVAIAAADLDMPEIPGGGKAYPRPFTQPKSFWLPLSLVYAPV